MSTEKEQEERLRQHLGNRIPTRAELLKNQLKQRKYFDSGDYAMSKAGHKPEPGQEIGSGHPVPEQIPHKSPLPADRNSSPVRHSSSLASGSEVVRIAASRDSSYTDAQDEAIINEDYDDAVDT